MGMLKDGDGVRLHAPAKQVWRERSGDVLLRGIGSDCPPAGALLKNTGPAGRTLFCAGYGAPAKQAWRERLGDDLLWQPGTGLPSVRKKAPPGRSSVSACVGAPAKQAWRERLTDVLQG